MKTLQEDLQQKRKGFMGYALPEKYESERTFEEFLDLNGINESDIHQHDIDFYYWFNFVKHKHFFTRWHSRYMQSIMYTLKSYSHEYLVKKISDKFGDRIVSCFEISKKDSAALPVCIRVDINNDFVGQLRKDTNMLAHTKEVDELYDILRECNYYISNISTYKHTRHCGYEILIEPMYTKCILGKIKRNGAHVYHITTRDKIDSIMKTGLRPRVSRVNRIVKEEKGYRYFAERVFLIGNCKTKEETINNIKSALGDLEKKDYVILDIDIRHYCIGLWKDDSSDGKYNVYTYEPIPPYIIKRVLTDVDEI